MFYIFWISIVCFGILLFLLPFLSYLIIFTKAVKTILHFKVGKHLDSEEATCFSPPVSQLKIKLLLRKQTESVCLLMAMSLRVCLSIAS